MKPELRMVERIKTFEDPYAVADAIIGKVGKKIVAALPLGLGKACHIANALVERALDDPSIDLQIFTALTLTTPQTKSDMRARFLGPAKTRLFGDYPEFLYTKLMRENKLPYNIKVYEFFLMAGQWLDNETAQRNYIPANYTYALPYLLERGLNVVLPLIAKQDGQYSFSCNPDIMADLLKARHEGQADFVFAGQTNDALPFMYGEAVFPEDEIDFLLDNSALNFELYSAPKRPVSLADQAIGLHAARLVEDGGTLQIGIGSIGDAIAKALILRHKNNDRYKQLVHHLDSGNNPAGFYHDDPFEEGLYGLSEMFVDAFLHLAENNILKREVNGAIFHGGFFVDCHDFYKKLRDMPEEKRKRFQMMPVSFTNELYHGEDEKREARVKARFINNAMMATVRGAIVSDALDDGRVISGVGGQYNFAAQSFALEDARFMITLPSTRLSKGEAVSNIVWSYGHVTLPWHMRDIVITEYGVADLRGKTDEEAIKAMLAITDSRFQDALLERAKSAGKIDKNWRIPNHLKNNTPERIEKILKAARAENLLPEFPFGSDFTDVEQRLMPALKVLKNKVHSKKELACLFFKGLGIRKIEPEKTRCLERMDLAQPSSLKEFVLQKILLAALKSADPI